VCCQGSPGTRGECPHTVSLLHSHPTAPSFSIPTVSIPTTSRPTLHGGQEAGLLSCAVCGAEAPSGICDEGIDGSNERESQGAAKRPCTTRPGTCNSASAAGNLASEAQAVTPPKLYTIGHGAHDIDTFVGLLRRHSIKTLLDVRSTSSLLSCVATVQPRGARSPASQARN
jgi:hypothetical protein